MLTQTAPRFAVCYWMRKYHDLSTDSFFLSSLIFSIPHNTDPSSEIGCLFTEFKLPFTLLKGFSCSTSHKIISYGSAKPLLAQSCLSSTSTTLPVSRSNWEMDSVCLIVNLCFIMKLPFVLIRKNRGSKVDLQTESLRPSNNWFWQIILFIYIYLYLFMIRPFILKL